MNHPLGFMSGSKIVFRGTLLPSNIVSQFALQKGISKMVNNYGHSYQSPDYIYLPGVTSTFLSFRSALNSIKSAMKTSISKSLNLQSVVFAICLQNFDGFNGFRMNSAMYSAHPEEQETVLMEGLQVAVLGVEDMFIDNSLDADPFWDDFNHKTVSVVYLFHTER